MTAGLAGTGAVLGAGLSAGLIASAGAVVGAVGVAVPGAGGPILGTAAIGAGLGAILTPLTALSLLRQVALGKALLFTMLGMSAGVTGGQLATGRPVIAAASGVGAFLLTALILRLTSGRTKKTARD